MYTAKKKVIGSLNKCYSVAKITDGGKPRLLCAAEKQDACYMFDTDGNKRETLWEGPGGVMTIEQFPDEKETIILATQKFYSPNDSAEAKIVYYRRNEKGTWECNVLCELPFVHRFAILSRTGVNYLVACTLKSDHKFKNDWTCPGRVFVAELPFDITGHDEAHQLELAPLISGLSHNHGFTKVTEEEGFSSCLVGCDNGVFQIAPPPVKGGEWETECLLEEAVSDMLYEDFDGDGERELLTLSPFHGTALSVWKDGGKVWEYPAPLPFLHAIYTAEIEGKKIALIGNREEEKRLLAVYYDPESGTYATDVLDEGAGPANVLFFEENSVYKAIAANRETDEIALYEISLNAD